MSNALVKQLSFLFSRSIHTTPCRNIRRSFVTPFSSTAIARQDPILPPKIFSPRRTWSTADTEKLFYLVNKYGNRWRVFTSYFPGRTSICIRMHYLSVKDDTTRWTLKEKQILQKQLGSQLDPNEIDWEKVQQALPKKRTIARIKHFWENSIHPTLNRGSWTDEETQRLRDLVEEHGTKWDVIAKALGTRGEDQCRNKWVYEASTTKKGPFSQEEDKMLTTAVQKYGLDQLHRIKQDMNSKRSISQLRTRYTNFLDPNVDRSPWTEKEKEQARKLFDELQNIRQVREKMNSKRSIRDMYNQLRFR